jgi:S-formylglutathione hydrolase FrmB
VARCAAASVRPFLHLACGKDDELGFAAGTGAFARALIEAGIPASVRIVPGRHDWAFWRAELPHALASFSERLAFV